MPQFIATHQVNYGYRCLTPGQIRISITGGDTNRVKRDLVVLEGMPCSAEHTALSNFCYIYVRSDRTGRDTLSQRISTTIEGSALTVCSALTDALHDTAETAAQHSPSRQRGRQPASIQPVMQIVRISTPRYRRALLCQEVVASM